MQQIWDLCSSLAAVKDPLHCAHHCMNSNELISMTVHLLTTTCGTVNTVLGYIVSNTDADIRSVPSCHRISKLLRPKFVLQNLEMKLPDEAADRLIDSAWFIEYAFLWNYRHRCWILTILRSDQVIVSVTLVSLDKRRCLIVANALQRCWHLTKHDFAARVREF